MCAGDEDGGEAQERRESGVGGEAEGAAEGDLEVDEEGEVAHAVGDLVQSDGKGGEPADAGAGEEGYGYGGSVDEAVEHAGEDEGGGAGSLGGVLVVVIGTGRADLWLGVGAGDDEEDALGGEERDHGGAGEGPGEAAVAELLDGFGEEVKQSRREEDAYGEGDDVGELAAEGCLAGAEEPGRGGGGELHGGSGEDGGDDPDGGDNCSFKSALRGRRAFTRLFTASRGSPGGREGNSLPTNGRPTRSSYASRSDRTPRRGPVRQDKASKGNGIVLCLWS